MKPFFFTIISIFLLTHCKQETKISLENSTIISSNVNFKENGEQLHLVIDKFSYDFNNSEVPFKRIVLLNSSLLGYFLELKAENTIIGLSSPEYVYSEKINNNLKSGVIQEIGNEQKYNIEKILSLKPDAVFTNYVANFENTYQLLKNNGIKLIFINEYLEQNPLEKAAYLKLFGRLLGKESEAEICYKKISDEYNKIKSIAKNASTSPSVLSNEMYGDIWYMPGGKTYTANYIKDANAQYILSQNVDDKAVTMSFEEVFVKSQKVNIWVNAGNHPSKKQLLQSNSLYEKLDPVKNGKIFVVNAKEKGKSNDFFESGVVRADLVLKDYVKIFHPELFPGYQLTYMKELR